MWCPTTVRGDKGQTRVDLDFCQAALIDQPTDDTEVQKTARALRDLEHYAHCYNRCYAHRQGQDFAAGQCLCVTHRMEDYIQMAGFQTANETDFIQSANETLVASRRLLKYAYICSYYSKRDGDEDKEHSHLGFLHLERLERFTEELSGVSENALTRRDRTRVLDLIAVVMQCMGLLACFEFHESVASAAEYNTIDTQWK